MHTVYYTGEFKPVERCVRKLNGVVDVWLRRNPREDADGVKCADEIVLTFPVDAAPSLDVLRDEIDDFFDAEAAPETTMQDVVDALNELTELILGGGLDA